MNTRLDPVETQEWLESFDAVRRFNGDGASSELIGKLTDHAREQVFDCLRRYNALQKHH